MSVRRIILLVLATGVLAFVARSAYGGVEAKKEGVRATLTGKAATATAAVGDTATAQAMKATATSMADEIATAEPDRVRQATTTALERQATATALARSRVVVVASQPTSIPAPPTVSAAATVAAGSARSSAAVGQLDRAIQLAVAHRNDAQADVTYLALTDALMQAHVVLANAPVAWAAAADKVVVAMFDAYNRHDLDTLLDLDKELDQLA